MVLKLALARFPITGVGKSGFRRALQRHHQIGRVLLVRLMLCAAMQRAKRLRRIGSLGMAALLILPTLAAQQMGEAKSLRFDLTPQVGYRTAISFPIDPHVSGTNPRVVLDASPSYGFAFGFRLHEDDVIEFRWARQDSHSHLEGTDLTSIRQHMTLNQFHGDFSHEYVVEDWKAWARPFVMLSVGATHIAGIGSASFTRFSFGAGGGVRFYMSRHWGFKIQAEWLPVFVDPHGTVLCGIGCVVHVGGTASSQGEATVGPLFRF